MNKRGKKRSNPPKFPVIEAAIEEMGGTYRFFAETGISSATYYFLQSDRGNPTKRTIDLILDYTGMKYEKAFKTENADQRVQDADRR